MEIKFHDLWLKIGNQREEFPSFSPEIASWPSVEQLHRKTGEIFGSFLELVKRNLNKTDKNWPNELKLQSTNLELFWAHPEKNSVLELDSFSSKHSIVYPKLPNAGVEELHHTMRYSSENNNTFIFGKCVASRIFTNIEDKVSCDYSVLFSGSLTDVTLTAYKDRFECLEKREDALQHDCTNEPLQFLPLNLSTPSDHFPAIITALTGGLFFCATIYAVSKFVGAYWNSGSNRQEEHSGIQLTELKIV